MTREESERSRSGDAVRDTTVVVGEKYRARQNTF